MKPKTKAEWSFVLNAIEWFLWLVREHSTEQVAKAMRAATEALK